MKTPVPSAPLNAVYATRSDFWRMVRLSVAGTTRALSRSWGAQLLFAALWTVVGAYAGLTSYLDQSPANVVIFPVAVAVGLVAFLFLVILISAAVRLIDRRRVIILSSDRSSVLDVLPRRSHVTIANHTKLSGTASAQALRAATASWLPTYTTLPLRFWAQNQRVARLYLRQFPALTRTGRKRVIGGVELEA